MRKITLLCMLLALTSLTGCATVFGDRYNHVNLTTTPAGAEYEIRNGADTVVASGVTPNLVKLKSSAGYFKRGTYNVRFSKAGYEDVQVPLTASMRGIYWGNLLVSGPIGLFIVDPASGAMWALPRNLTSDLKPGGPVALVDPPPLQPSVLSKDEQLDELRHTPGLSYEEYMRRYQDITNQ